jgi:hypothetical protein
MHYLVKQLFPSTLIVMFNFGRHYDRQVNSLTTGIY